MATNEVIEIPLDKKRMDGQFFGSFVFILAGISFILNAALFNDSFLYAAFQAFLGVVLLLYFVAYVWFRYKNKPDMAKSGLRVDDQGVWNRTLEGTDECFVPWKDIQHIERSSSMGVERILIRVYNPDDYRSRTKSMSYPIIEKIFFSLYGSPLQINVSKLQITAGILLNTLERKREEVQLQSFSFETSK